MTSTSNRFEYIGIGRDIATLLVVSVLGHHRIGVYQYVERPLLAMIRNRLAKDAS